MRPAFPVLFTSPELRGTGVIGLVGAATAATYNPLTGAGTVTRVDLSNQSYITVPAITGRAYKVDITVAQIMQIRVVATGAVLATIQVGQSVVQVIPTQGALVFTSASGTANFTINSIRAR